MSEESLEIWSTTRFLGFRKGGCEVCEVYLSSSEKLWIALFCVNQGFRFQFGMLSSWFRLVVDELVWHNQRGLDDRDKYMI